jgi:hypothetical protein
VLNPHYDSEGGRVCDAQKKPVGVISLQDLARSESEGEIGQTVREVKEEGARGSLATLRP